MALFGSKKNTDKKTQTSQNSKQDKKDNNTEKKVTKSENTNNTQHSVQDFSRVIVKPRVTEKASIKSENGVYVFEVSTTANKASVARAVKELYNVTPVRVAVTPIPTKKIFSQGKWGTKRGGKKAYVYLKQGDKIEII